jgi:hypothetical protein
VSMARPGGSNSRPSGSQPFELLCQIFPEEWLIERNQQVGANSRNLLLPSVAAVCRIFATFSGKGTAETFSGKGTAERSL